MKYKICFHILNHIGENLKTISRKAPEGDAMSTTETFVFGAVDGRNVQGFRMHNAHGMIMEVIEYGARIRSLRLPRPRGGHDEITVGFDRLEDYLGFNLYFGAVIGRTAGRTGSAPFELDGESVTLTANAGTAHQHGGKTGFDRVFWRGSVEEDGAVRLEYRASHLEEGYPGNLHAAVVFRLNDENVLSIVFEGTTDRATPVDMTSHVYLNLNGVGNRNVQNEHLVVNASRFLNKTPTSEEDLILPVDNTPFDLRLPRTLSELSGDSLFNPVMVLDGDSASVREVARVYVPSLGRGYVLSATGSAMQVYNAFNIPEVMAGNGVHSDLEAGCGLCLEPQGFPDAVHHPSLPGSILRPGETYRHELRFAFVF